MCVLQYCVAPPGHGHRVRPTRSSTKTSRLHIVPTGEDQDVFISQQHMLKKKISASMVPLQTFVFSRWGDPGAELYF